MAYIHIQINEELRKRIEAYAAARDITMAAAVRILLHEKLRELGD